MRSGPTLSSSVRGLVGPPRFLGKIFVRREVERMSTHNGNHRNLEHSWKTDLRWEGITRPYSAKEVEQLRGSVHIEHTLARLGAERLWQLLQDDLYVAAL